MKKNTLNINLAEMSDSEIYAFREMLSVEREKIDDQWADEVGEVTKGDFDPYSTFAERKLKKIGKKYAEMGSGITYLQELVAEEIRKRDQYKEEQRYSGKNKFKNDFEMSQDEFLEREEIITQSYKSKIE